MEKTSDEKSCSESKIKKEYSLLAKKYSLPTLDTIEKEFSIYDIEVEKYPLVDIRKRINDKIDYFAGILGHILEGEATLSNIYESKVLDEEKKAELFKIYKRLMKHARASAILSLSYDEKEEAEFVKSFTKEWADIKQNLKKQFKMLCEAWDSDSDVPDEILHYLG